ncbi:MAG: oligosaccharide flippase family protein [Lachnospiraceae bacterium]|jgi:stage V sporulation protein B|nr:oligosaccharide flippase family protein [Lachnospiraceae bacterium]
MKQPFFSLSPKKRAFLTGTLLLTGTGFLCRILGFFYRIFMSRTIGAEGLGIYNMVHPVFGICFALCAGSIQTALSQYVASNQKKGRAVFRTGLLISLTLSFFLAFLIYHTSPFIARYLLLEPRCEPYLLIMAFSVPFAALHACINGYYYGMQKSHVPAFSQVTEQVIRMTAVFGIVQVMQQSGKEITVSLAVYGHLIGEMASAAFTLFCLMAFPPAKKQTWAALHSQYVPSHKPGKALEAAKKADKASAVSFCTWYTDTQEDSFRWTHYALPLLALALPLMGNRLVLNLLASAEAIWIPNRLTAYGLSSSQAFSIYGVLTGMALPFIMFPSAITNSMAVLLLPSVAQAQAEGDSRQISSAISMALRYSLYMGILCTGIFFLYGRELGSSVFQSPAAGAYIRVLGWLCPFMYLATTLGSILNGLGKTPATFIQNVCSLCLRLVFVLLGIPVLGMKAYLWGILASEMFLAFWHLITLHRFVPFTWDGIQMLGKPIILLSAAIWTNQALWNYSMLFLPKALAPGASLAFFGTALKIISLSGLYGLFLLLCHIFLSERPA